MALKKAVALSRARFEEALRDGRGAALAHTLAYGLDGLSDLVLNACLVNQAYDPQCEGGRAPWLYEMFRGSPVYPEFSAAIQAALRDIRDEYSLEQMCDLAGLMAVDGDTAAAVALREFVWAQDASPDTDQYGWCAIAALDGLPAIVELARRAGRILRADPEAFPDSLTDLTERTGLYNEALQELQGLAVSEADIAVYLAYEQKRVAEDDARVSASEEENATRREQYREQIRRDWPVEAMFAAAADWKNSRRFVFSRFARFATGSDIERVLQQLEKPLDLETCLRLMWALRRLPLPYVPAKVWQLVEHDDKRHREAALLALAGVRSPEVADFARKYVSSNRFTAEHAEVIELFTNNYRVGDEDLIGAALRKLQPDDEQAHSIGLSALKFVENNMSPELRAVARWVYRYTPCTICRRSIVEWMIETDTLQAVIAEECAYDADPDTQALASDWLGKHSRSASLP